MPEDKNELAAVLPGAIIPTIRVTEAKIRSNGHYTVSLTSNLQGGPVSTIKTDGELEDFKHTLETLFSSSLRTPPPSLPKVPFVSSKVSLFESQSEKQLLEKCEQFFSWLLTCPPDILRSKAVFEFLSGIQLRVSGERQMGSHKIMHVYIGQRCFNVLLDKDLEAAHVIKAIAEAIERPFWQMSWSYQGVGGETNIVKDEADMARALLMWGEELELHGKSE